MAKNHDLPGRDTRDDGRLTLTVKQTAAVLGISPWSAYRRIAEGTLPSLRLGKRLVVPRIALERLLLDGTIDSGTS